MTNQDRSTQPWPAGRRDQRPGYYDYKNVRFKLSRSTNLSGGWVFQPFGRESQEFATWQDLVAALEAACVEIAQHRAERRNR